MQMQIAQKQLLGSSGRCLELLHIYIYIVDSTLDFRVCDSTPTKHSLPKIPTYPKIEFLVESVAKAKSHYCFPLYGLLPSYHDLL